MAKRARGKSRGSYALGIDANAEFGDFVEPVEHVQAIVLAAPSPTPQPRLVPPLAAQQPLLDAVSENRANLTRELLVAEEDIKKTEEEAFASLRAEFQLYKREAEILAGEIKGLQNEIMVFKTTSAVEIAALKMTSTVEIAALKDEQARQTDRLDKVEGWILAGHKEQIITSIRQRIALDQVQAELALRAGVVTQRSAFSSDDSAVWRARLATEALQETAVDDDQGRLAAGRALLRDAAENDEDLARLINSGGMRLLTQKTSSGRHRGNLATHETPLDSLTEATDNGENKAALDAIQVFLTRSGIYQSSHSVLGD